MAGVRKPLTEAVIGIEVNSYAAELARLTVWITELQ
jgi:hypothetical protein